MEKQFTQVSVIGSGRWGTFLAWYLSKYCAKEVMLYGLETAEDFQELKAKRSNEYLTLTDNVKLTSDLAETLNNQFIVVSVGVQSFRSLCKEMHGYNLKDKTLLLAMKGLEENSCKRPSEIAAEELAPNDYNLAVLVGPGHVQDYLRGVPSCALIDSRNDFVKQEVARYFNSNLIRTYYGNDLVGSEIGAALKNVVGLAAGILDGIGWSGLKGALMGRATIEVARFIVGKGGKFISAYGLAHLGDYEATLFSPHSHNRKYGEGVAKGQTFEKLAEGVPTLKAVYNAKGDIHMPICDALYEVIYQHSEVEATIRKLFECPIKPEFFSLDW